MKKIILKLKALHKHIVYDRDTNKMSKKLKSDYRTPSTIQRIKQVWKSKWNSYVLFQCTRGLVGGYTIRIYIFVVVYIVHKNNSNLDLTLNSNDLKRSNMFGTRKTIQAKKKKNTPSAKRRAAKRQHLQVETDDKNKDREARRKARLSYNK